MREVTRLVYTMFLFLILVSTNFSFSSLFSFNSEAKSFENYIPNSSSLAQVGANVAVGPFGDLYVVWKEYDDAISKYRIYFSLSKDGGKSWLQTPVEVGKCSNSAKLGITANEKNEVYVAYNSLYDPSFPSDYWCVKKLIRNSDGTYSFQYASTNSHGSESISDIQLASGNDTNPFSCLIYTYSGAVQIRRSDVNNWGTYGVIQGVSGDTYTKPKVSVYGKCIAVAYIKNGNDVLFKANMGSGFPADAVTISGYSIEDLDVGLFGNELYITWTYFYTKDTNTYYNLNFTRLSYKDGNWNVEKNNLVNDYRKPCRIATPVIAVARGTVYVSWSDNRYQSVYGSEIYYDYTTDKGTTFGLDKKVNKDYSGPTEQKNVSISCAYGFGPYVVWEDNRSLPSKICVEDLSSARTETLSAIYHIDGISLPEMNITDIEKYEKREYRNETWIYSASIGSWVNVTPTTSPTNRTKHSLTAIDTTNKLLMFGGDVRGTLNSETWCYDISTKEWTNKNPSSGPSARCEHAISTIYNCDDVMLFGGYDGTNYLQQTWTYDYGTNTWTQQSITPQPSGRAGHAMATIYGTDMVLLFGGYSVSGLGVTTYYSDTWIYDRSLNSWTSLSISGPGGRRFHSLSTITDTSTDNRYILLFGGEDGSGKLGDTWLFTYDTMSSSGSWSRLSIPGPSPRLGHAMAPIYGTKKVLLQGGEDDFHKGLADVWVFDKGNNSWKRYSNSSAERSFHALATPVGFQDLVLFGGYVNYHYIFVSGENRVLILKYTAGIPKFQSIQLTTPEGSNVFVNALAVRWNKIIAVGGSKGGASRCEVWAIDFTDEGLTAQSPIREGYDWESWYPDGFEDICYKDGESIMLLSAKKNGNQEILVVRNGCNDFTSFQLLYPVTSMCSRGSSGYYIFTYDTTNKVNVYYTHSGTYGDSPSQISVSGGPKGPINDAYSILVDNSNPSQPVIFTYLAASAYVGTTSTRGLYKLTASGSPTSYSATELNINGDCDKFHFNYTSVDVCVDSGTAPQNITVILSGTNNYTEIIEDGTKTGFYAKFKEMKVGNLWKLDTLNFVTTEKKEFCVTRLLDASYYSGNSAIIGGLKSSPSLFFVGGDINENTKLITNVTSINVTNVRITIPGDGSTVNRMNQQFTPTGTNYLEFHVDITVPATLPTIKNIKFQAWYDDPDGDGVEDSWDEVKNNNDKNARVEIIADRDSATGVYQFSMLYPTLNEVSFDKTYCSAVENGLTVSLKFAYAPMKQARYAYGGVYGDGSSSVSTWNFQFAITDDTGELPSYGGSAGNNGDGWEFGFDRVTSFVGIMNRNVNNGEGVEPLKYATTDNFTIVWSSNNDYKISVEMKTPLSGGSDTIDYKYVMAHEAFNYTDGFVGNDFTSDDNILNKDNYKSFNEQYRKILWYGNTEDYWDAPSIGNEQKFSTNFLVYVPMGTKSKTYTAVLTYLLDIDTKPCSPRYHELRLGGTAVDETPNNYYFGYSVACAGDVNGDGYDDVIIGAYGYNSCKGKVYLYLGSISGISGTASWTAEGEYEGEYFGVSVASAGDVNGDGYDDVIIGACGYNSYKGKAYLYLGSVSGLSSSWTAVGETPNNYFGYSVACAGDVNGDGYDDVIIGAYGYNSCKGKVYLYLGSATGLSTSSAWTAEGEYGGDWFGNSVACAGDVNGDGYDDVIVGASVHNSEAGKAYLYLGSATGLSPSSAWTAVGTNEEDNFGYSVACAGDVNGDGYDDVIIGAYGYSSGKGKAYLYLGSATGLSPSSAWTAVGANDGDNFGYSVACAGDVNGDGYDDVIIGAYGYSSGKGKAYLYLGSASGISETASWTAVGEATNNYFGRCVASAGDVNDDEYDDVIIGAYGYNSNQGKAYLYL